MFRRVIALLSLSIGGATTCTSLTTVRPAELRQGLSITAQASVASPPGDAAAWFWSFDCAQNCNQMILGGDLAFAYVPRTRTGRPYSIGLGLNGFFPYAEGFVQADTSSARPFGIGARLGLPLWGWAQHQLYARVDWPLGSDRRLLWNPGLVYHTGHSPNGDNSGTFVGLTQGAGMQLGVGPTVLIPSAALVWGHAHHRTGAQQFGPENRVFGTFSISVMIRGDK